MSRSPPAIAHGGACNAVHNLDQPTRRAGTNKPRNWRLAETYLFTYSRMRKRVKSGPLGFLFRETRSRVHFHFHFHFHSALCFH